MFAQLEIQLANVAYRSAQSSVDDGSPQFCLKRRMNMRENACVKTLSARTDFGRHRINSISGGARHQADNELAFAPHAGSLRTDFGVDKLLQEPRTESKCLISNREFAFPGRMWCIARDRVREYGCPAHVRF